jgi:hypothetical protein
MDAHIGCPLLWQAERSADSISQELFSIQEYKGSLAAIAVNEPMRRLYSIGDNLCVNFGHNSF